jgi:hypothetical protein
MHRKLLWESKWIVEVTGDCPLSHRLQLLLALTKDAGANVGRKRGRAEGADDSEGRHSGTCIEC